MADTKITALTVLAASAVADDDEIPIVDISDTTMDASGTTKAITRLSLVPMIVKSLASDSTTNSTVTPTNVSGIDVTLVAGTYVFQYYVRYQATLATTGVRFSVNFTGTATTFTSYVRFGDVAATASTAAPDQDQVLATAGVMSTFAARAKSTAGWGTTLSVDTINADMLTIIEGVFVATTSGDLELWHGSEVAAASTVKAGTSVIITKTG